MLVSRQVAPEYTSPRPQAPERRPAQPRRDTAAQPSSAARRAALARWALGGALWVGVTAVGLLYVQRSGEAARLSIHISEQRAQISRLQTENELLQVQVHDLKALSRIAAVATKPVEEGGLGMITPPDVHVVVVNPAGLTMVKPATLAQPAETAAETGLWARIKGLIMGGPESPAEASAQP